MDDADKKIGFVCERRDDGIIVYRFYDMKRESIDAWFNATVQHDQEFHASGKHSRRMFIFERFLTPTPYAFTRAREALHQTPPGLRESQSCIVPSQAGFRLITMFIHRIALNRNDLSVTLPFMSEAKGVDWLNKRL